MADLDLVLVVADGNRGWVLDTICREIARHHAGRTAVHYGVRRVPRARAYFFSHPALFGPTLRHNPLVGLRRTVVFFTHPSVEPAEARRVARRLRYASAVVSMSSMHARALIAHGLPAHKVHVIIPGTDPERFVAHRRDGTGAVGFCSAYYARKDPGRMVEVVRAMPDRRFLLVGKGWPGWPGFAALRAQPNFTYAEPAYEDYPAHYAAMDVLVSPSRLEGGPLPVLEAMMANVVPVCSRTGFGPDLIEPGRNGFLFDVDAPAAAVCELVEAAYALDVDVRATVADRTWARFGAEVQALTDGRA